MTATHVFATLIWRRLDRPGHDAFRVRHDGERGRLEGCAIFRDESGLTSRLSYEVVCDARWHTRSAHIEGWVGDEDVCWSILHDTQQGWQFNGTLVPSVTHCIDVDLGFTPATNLLPLRRLRLAPGQQGEVPAAWFDPSTRRLQPLPQSYRRLDASRYHYRAPTVGFEAELQVGAEGLVHDYPGLWRAEP
ncbi:putative glycolipid-binding domain-containing protein [uncultured Pseudacidovorax sp.]|uniref:putative glycolipid-binding domain-containing protein n=1 Tax=uncultured Pseudacidovorax sp. TaxID=679313 RepID=UPI0025EF28D7|nr:putative glycolipid-binding domain-containing protein [uncultured Pseudacidovorax sp.]